MRVLITGASGTGTTTLGQALAEQLGVAFFDADNYYWLPTTPRFNVKRSSTSRLELILGDLQKEQSAIVAGSVVNWGIELEDGFSLIVFLTLNTEIRLARLSARELSQRGEINSEFIIWAAQYEKGYLPGRSLARQERWLSERSTCPVLRLDGDLPVTERLKRVMEVLCNETIGTVW